MRLLLMCVLICALMCVGCRQGESELRKDPDVSAAVAYQWLGKHTKKTDRVVVEGWLYIPPSAGLAEKTPADRAKARMHTTLKAALDLHHQASAPDCTVSFLVEEDNKALVGDLSAARIKAIYSPDGGGVGGSDKLLNGTFAVAVRPGEPISQ